MLLSSHAIDKDSLCIARGKLAWTVAVTVEVVSYDGNLIDLACMSVLLALKNVE